MKKAKILAVILVMSLMLTGVAYALWNDTVELSTSAAMGKMDVAIEADNWVYPLSYMPGIGGECCYTWQDIKDYMNPLTGIVAGDNQSIDVTVGNMYPGAKYGVDFVVRNTGTVPFSLEGVTITCTNNWDLFSKLKGGFAFLFQHEDGTYDIVEVSEAALTTEGLGAAIVNACEGIVLYPNDELKCCYANQDGAATIMQVLVDDTISGDDFELQSTSFKVAFNWQQCNPVYFDMIGEAVA